MNKKFSVTIVSLFLLLFAISFVAADLAVLGTVYESGLGGTLSSGAIVSATCAGVTHSDTTTADGLYAVLFDTGAGECPNGSTMDIVYSKPLFNSFSGSRGIDYAKIKNSGSLFSIIADHSLVSVTPSPSPSSGGGSSGGSFSGCYSEFWDCGDWGECSEEEQTRQCTSNCGSVKTELQICGEDLEESNEAGEEELFSEIEVEEDSAPAQGFLARITGAVVGTLGSGGSFVAAIFIAIVIAGFVYTRSKADEDAE